MDPTRPHGDSRNRAILEGLEVAVILAALFTVPLTIVELNGQGGASYEIADWIVWAVFAVDYAGGLALTLDRRTYVRRSWLGLAVVLLSFPLLPAAAGFLRLTRATRFLRLARLLAFSSRALPAIKATVGRKGVLYLAAVLFMLVTVSGAAMSVVEPQTVKGDIWDGMWWAIVTATTVGYGDISPITPIGRLIAVALMLTGIGLTATLAASIAAHFVNDDQGADELHARLDRIELALNEIRVAGRTEGLVQSKQDEEAAALTGHTSR